MDHEIKFKIGVSGHNDTFALQYNVLKVLKHETFSINIGDATTWKHLSTNMPLESQEHIELLSTILLSNNSVENIILYNNKIQEHIFASLLKKFNFQLKYLSITKNDLSNNMMSILSSTLITLNSLTKLVLSSNKISSTGANCMLQLLIENSSKSNIQHLFLDNNFITHDASQKISECIYKLSKLQTLHLNNNLIGDDGLSNIITNIQKSNTKPTISKIFLSNNFITSLGISTFITLLSSDVINPIRLYLHLNLKDKSSIIDSDLAYNTIDKSTARSLLIFLAAYPSFTIDSNSFSLLKKMSNPNFIFSNRKKRDRTIEETNHAHHHYGRTQKLKFIR